MALAALTACNAGNDYVPPTPDGGVALDDGGGTPNDGGMTPNDGGTITCTPVTLDFGTVAANIGATIPMICTADVAWSVVSLAGSIPVFTAQADPRSPSSVGAGQSLEIDVTYLPTATESDTGTLRLVSSLDSTPVTIARLSGNAILEQPCYYSITPESIQFGQVAPGTTFTQGVTLTDLGPFECLLTGFSDTCGGDGGGPGPPVYVLRLSPPGGDGAYPNSISIPVELTCTQPGSVACDVQFSINAPGAPTISIPIVANCVGSALPDGG